MAGYSLFQDVADRLVECQQGEQCRAAQCRQYPAFWDQYAILSYSLVFGQRIQA